MNKVWELVREREEAERRGRVPLLEAIAAAYPADEVAEDVAAEDICTVEMYGERGQEACGDEPRPVVSLAESGSAAPEGILCGEQPAVVLEGPSVAAMKEEIFAELERRVAELRGLYISMSGGSRAGRSGAGAGRRDVVYDPACGSGGFGTVFVHGAGGAEEIPLGFIEEYAMEPEPLGGEPLPLERSRGFGYGGPIARIFGREGGAGGDRESFSGEGQRDGEDGLTAGASGGIFGWEARVGGDTEGNNSRREALFIGESNIWARAAAGLMGESRERVSHPVVVWGGAGAGKSLLARMAAYLAGEQGGRRAVWVPWTGGLDGFVGSMRRGEEQVLAEVYQGYDVIAVDGVRFGLLGGGEPSDFGRFLRAVWAAGKRVLVTCGWYTRWLPEFRAEVARAAGGAVFVSMAAPDAGVRRRVLEVLAGSFRTDREEELKGVLARRLCERIKGGAGIERSLVEDIREWADCLRVLCSGSWQAGGLGAGLVRRTAGAREDSTEAATTFSGSLLGREGVMGQRLDSAPGQEGGLLSRIDFGRERGEELTSEEIRNLFVRQESFSGFLESKHRTMLVLGKYGAGKSTLINWIANRLQEEKENALVIQCKGHELVRASLTDRAALKSSEGYQRDWLARLCTLVSQRLAQKLSLGNGEEETLRVEEAEIDNFQGGSLFSTLLDRVLVKGLARVRKEARAGIAGEIELLRRRAGKGVWILIDDLDAVDEGAHEAGVELGRFFSACRRLSSEAEDVFLRATMRSEAWARARHGEESLSKTGWYVSEISWSREDFRKLLFRRIRPQVELLQRPIARLGAQASEEEMQEAYLDFVFARGVAWGGFERKVSEVIYTLSYQRPRWALELCTMARLAAVRAGAAKIEREHFEGIWGEYRAGRIRELIEEHKHRCAQIAELVESLRGAEGGMNWGALLRWIESHITEHVRPVIEGKVVKSASEIAAFLFRIGFLVARSGAREGGFEQGHVPGMVRELARGAEEEPGAVWEVHPCYREAVEKC